MHKELILKLILVGFSLKEAWRFLEISGILKPWKIYEEEGFAIVNDYALEKIIVI